MTDEEGKPKLDAYAESSWYQFMRKDLKDKLNSCIYYQLREGWSKDFKVVDVPMTL